MSDFDDPEQQDDLDDRELPDESDFDDDDQPDIIPCPHCRRAISEDAEQCHHCGEYVSHEDSAGRTSIVLTIIVCGLVLAVLLAWLIAK